MVQSRSFLFVFIPMALLTGACYRKTFTSDASVWSKVEIDFNRLDADGLTGPPGGKVSAHYEFCIPAHEKYWKEVKKRDATAVLHRNSAGRAGCKPGVSWLVVGSTHQKNYRRVLYDIASLEYVKKILETFYE